MMVAGTEKSDEGLGGRMVIRWDKSDTKESNTASFLLSWLSLLLVVMVSWLLPSAGIEIEVMVRASVRR